MPISNELSRYTRALLRAKPPEEISPRTVFRFRTETEPWAREAARFAGGGEELERAIEEARTRDPAEPLLRGDELGLPPGPEIGRLLGHDLDARGGARARPAGIAARGDERRHRLVTIALHIRASLLATLAAGRRPGEPNSDHKGG